MNGIDVSKVKKDLLFVVESTSTDPEIQNEKHMYMELLMLFQQHNAGKNWPSREKMIEKFINQMKVTYCSVHAYHNYVFDNLHFKPKSLPPKIKLTQ